MSNLIGVFFTGKTMVGADPDTSTGALKALVVGRSRFVDPVLSLAHALSGNVVGQAVVTGTLSTEPVGAQLTGTIVGQAIVTATLTTVTRPQLTAQIVGRTTFIAPVLSHAVSISFYGSAAAMSSRTLTSHGEVLSGTGTEYRTTYQADPQPVHYFV